MKAKSGTKRPRKKTSALAKSRSSRPRAKASTAKRKPAGAKMVRRRRPTKTRSPGPIQTATVLGGGPPTPPR